jgi:hypothetical protein
MIKVVRTWLGQFMSFRWLGYFALAIIIFFLFFWRLSSLTPGLAPSEVSTRSISLGLHNIYHDPINAPHKLLQFVFLKLSPHSAISLRLPSVIAAGIFGLCFYRLASGWFGRLIGLFGTLIFISLPLFIVAGRSGSGQIMLFSPIVLSWLYVWLLKTGKSKPLVWSLLILSSSVLIYTPGIIWFIAGSLLISRKRIMAAISEIRPLVSGLSLALAGLLVAPLAASSINNPSIIKRLLLIPDHWHPATTLAKNFGQMLLTLFARTPAHNQLVLSRLPLLSVVVVVLVVFGVYAMQAAARAKAVWLGLLVLFAVTAAAVNNDLIYLALGLPAIGLLAAAGLRYLYIEWRNIFPRNPVPKTFALVLIAAVTLSQLYFGIRYALVAWPQSVATRTTYVLK